VIYLDSSVVLAQIFAEDRSLSETTIEDGLISSRLLEYEVWNRIHARGFAQSHAKEVETLLGRVSLMDLTPEVIGRALKPFPISVRTLDGLHLAAVEFLRARGEDIELASVDRRLIAAARALGIAIYSI
jgi:predicted nucleic acid-binding protein